ncbi:putative XRE-type DNA-binding protein [Salinibacter ruber]|jgi:predicted XRE-type DNA-binding protein|uniref:helix-turn-helix domain-containing protein n=1 Tax=Salinibacter ruber TaxID=146919 RepID=UPI00216906AC|nr:helix-turn-helix transcriptional regulator [Salinibacter ruber]MCS3666413.1 putative XRE-type DNA-binding protein [Salinibacter ruber]
MKSNDKTGTEPNERSSGDAEITESTGNVFADLGFEAEEAANLKVRARLMVRLRRFIKERGMTQDEAADYFGVNQPRISDLVNKKIDKFSIDTLVNMLTQAGVGVKIDFNEAESSSNESAKVPA